MKIFPKILNANEIKVNDYFQRGKYHFLVYNLDGSINGKNSGLYLPPVNFLNKLEFFVNINNKWVNIHEHLKKVKLHGFMTQHFYEIGDISLNLEYFLPDNHPLLRIMIGANKKVQLKIKPHINFGFTQIPYKNPLPEYSCKTEKGNIIIASNFDDKTCLMFNSSKPLKKIVKKGLDCILINSKKSQLNIVCSETGERGLLENLKEGKRYTKKEKEKRYKRYVYGGVNLKSNNKELNKAFEFAKYNLYLSRHRAPGIGRGFLAGVPYFLSYFGRDSFWSIKGALLLGDFKHVKDCLNMFAKYQSEVSTESKKPGKIPHEIWLNGEPNYYSTDSSLLFIISLLDYYYHTQDKEYLEDIFPTIKQTLGFITKSLEKGRINHGKLGFLKDTTWMDSYNRGNTAIEMQALVVACLDASIKIASILKNKKLMKEWKQEREKAFNVLKGFKKNGFWIDHQNQNKTPSKSITANPLFLLVLNLVTKQEAVKINEFLEKNQLITDYGVRSRAKNSQGYSPGKYHKGGIWPFLTGIYLTGIYRYKIKDRFNMLNNFHKYYQTFSYGMAPEYINGSNFSFKSLNHKSCFLCLWSSALFIRAALEGVCGIHVKKGKLVVSPNLPKNMEVEVKNFILANNVYNIKIKGKKAIVKKIKK